VFGAKTAAGESVKNVGGTEPVIARPGAKGLTAQQQMTAHDIQRDERSLFFFAGT
jgi:hypothetical protein